MGWGSVFAGLSGGLRGVSQLAQDVAAREQQAFENKLAQERLAQQQQSLDQSGENQQLLRMLQLAQFQDLARDRGSRQVTGALTRIPQGGMVDPNLAARAKEYDLGDMVNEVAKVVPGGITAPAAASMTDLSGVPVPVASQTTTKTLGSEFQRAPTPEEAKTNADRLRMQMAVDEVAKTFGPNPTPDQQSALALMKAQAGGLTGATGYAGLLNTTNASTTNVPLGQQYLDAIAKGDTARARQIKEAANITDNPQRPFAPIVIQTPMGPMVTTGPDRQMAVPVTTPGTAPGAPPQPIGRPLSAGAVSTLAQGESLGGIISDLNTAFLDPSVQEWIGPGWGHLIEAKIKIPGTDVSPALAKFYAQTNALNNTVIRMITGAQMSAQEADRIKKQLPKFTDKPEVWKANMAATMKNIAALEAATLRLTGNTNTPFGGPNVGAVADELRNAPAPQIIVNPDGTITRRPR